MLLELRDVSSGYGRSEIVRGVDLTVDNAEAVAVLGPNGAGKTTLLRTIAGLVPVRAGQLLIDGTPVKRHDPPSAVRGGIVLVPEGRQIFHSLTVRENLLMGAFLRRRDASVAADLERMLGYFPMLGDKLSDLGSAMSGGQQQMLAIARGLMARPRLLLLDEPTLGLSPVAVQALQPLIAHLAAEFDAAVLLVEQSAAFALHIAALMEGGRLAPAISAANMLVQSRGENLYMRQGAAAAAGLANVEHPVSESQGL